MENLNKEIGKNIKKEIINELKCKICKGIIRECNGISECFHLFCENCIEEYLNKYKENKIIRCPFCKKEWGNYKECNSMKIRINEINEIINIIFPSLKEENEKSKKEFFLNIKREREKIENLNENKIQIQLHPLSVENPKEKLPQISKYIIEVKMNTPFSEIKKNICKKLGISDLNYDEIVLNKQGLPIDQSFTDIQSYCEFDKNFVENNERILFYSRKVYD